MPAEQAAAGPHAPAELVAALRLALAEVATVEPIVVDERTAAKLLSVSTKTVARIPDGQIGRLRIGDGNRSVRYLVSALRKYAEERAKKQSRERPPDGVKPVGVLA